MDDNQKELFGFIKSKLTDLIVGKQNFSQLFCILQKIGTKFYKVTFKKCLKYWEFL